jgi:acetolactate synthase I/II/III large subunit
MSKRNSPVVGRRNFLKGATLVGAAAVTPRVAQAQPPAAPLARAVPRPNLVAETMPPSRDPVTQTTGGGDFMVDVLKTLDLDYCAISPASMFRGVQEAIVNYGKNVKPELLTCTHEEIAASMAQGYAKMENKPMAVMTHGTVGLQHAAMALYNSFCDRVPIYLMVGNIIDAEKRAPGGDWVHSAQDPASLVRDFVKWDDQPTSLQHFAESAVRAYKIATTPPMAPVMLSLDTELQENPISDVESLHIPKLAKVAPPQGDSGAIKETGKLLAAAENPVLIVDRMVRTQAGMDGLVELAELLQCPVVDQAGRMNFPSRHPLNHSFRRNAVVSQADVIVGIELNDYWGVLHSYNDRIVRKGQGRALYKPGTKLVSLGVRDLFTKANYQEFQRYAEVDIAIGGDGEASLPALIDAVKRAIDAGRKSAYEARGKKLAAAKLQQVAQFKSDATIGWDASPVTMGRLCAELYAQIHQADWSLVGNGIRNFWPHRLWNFDKAHRWNGASGGGGVGYNAPASLGAALANKAYGRLTVTINGDGDLMFTPGTLWTAAHHRIPILYVVHNNRAYHQEYMYVQAMANRRARGIENAHIGTTLRDPNIDYAALAKSLGVHGEGPITDPNDLAPALSRALALVRNGEPALVDVVTEPR